MYNEEKFNVLKTLVEDNAELLSQMSVLRERIDMLDSAKFQDGESFKTSQDVKELCDEVIKKCDCAETRSIARWFKTYYDLICLMANDLEYVKPYQETLKYLSKKLKENQDTISYLFAQGILD